MLSGLRATQELLLRLITSGATDNHTCGQIVIGDERLDAGARVAIYANMYRARLLEVMREDFPTTRSLLGEDGFDRAVSGYLAAYPPRHHSLSQFGRHFAEYLARDPVSDRFPVAADLARLERALIDSFHAADARALSHDAMRAVAAADWPTLRMRTHPAALVLELRWRVAELRRATDEGRELPAPDRAQSAILVWRKRNQCYYREIDRAEHAGLDTAAQGAAFSDICDAVAGAAIGVEAAARVGNLLDRWLRDGILVAD